MVGDSRERCCYRWLMTVSEDIHYSEPFVVRSESVDPQRCLRPERLCGYLQDVSHGGAVKVQLDASDLGAPELSWVLQRQTWQLRRPLRWREPLRVRTWPATGGSRLFAVRDYRIEDAQDQVVLQASSQWMVVSLTDRSLIKLPASIQARMAGLPLPPRQLDPPRRLPNVDRCEQQSSLQLRRADIDALGHVNNTVYVVLLSECLPEALVEGSWMSGLDIVYRREARLGDRVISSAQPGAAPGQWDHSLRREADGAELIRAQTRWRPHE